VLSEKKAEHFKQLLETRISELNRVLATAEQETRASAASCRADTAREFRRVRRMRRWHRAEAAGSDSVGALLRQVSGSKGARL